MSLPTTQQELASAEYLLTTGSVEAIRAELQRLRTVKEGEISERLREARGYGEPGGNDDLLAIREEEVVLDARIASLEAVLRRASVVEHDEIEPDTVAIGSYVTVEDRESGSSERYRVVGMHQGIGPGEVSAGSPVGRALLGKRRGETATVELPNGHVRRLHVVATESSLAASKAGD